MAAPISLSEYPSNTDRCSCYNIQERLHLFLNFYGSLFHAPPAQACQENFFESFTLLPSQRPLNVMRCYDKWRNYHFQRYSMMYGQIIHKKAKYFLYNALFFYADIWQWKIRLLIPFHGKEKMQMPCFSRKFFVDRWRGIESMICDFSRQRLSSISCFMEFQEFIMKTDGYLLSCKKQWIR